jgi:predicted phage gp36 major capsid-like protein
MSTLAEVDAEIERLEAVDADTGLGPNGLANLAQARKTRESLERQERRQRQEIKKAVTDEQSQFGADLTEGFELLKAFMSKRDAIMQSRQRVRQAEQTARAEGITLEHSYIEFETGFFTSPAYRALDNDLRLMFGSGKVLG